MARVRRALRILAVAGLLLAAGCGDDDGAGTAPSAGAGNATDRAFVAEMVPHHEAAIEMAAIAKARGESAFVKELAAEIIRAQEAEIATLRREDAGLAEQGVERGSLGLDDAAMGMDHDTGTLAGAKPFDAAFLRMMLPHHEGALTMSRVELDRGADPELKALAQQIVDGQAREIARMREHLGRTAGADGDATHGGDGDTMHDG